MSSYIDGELAEALSITIRKLTELQSELDSIKRQDINKETPPVKEIHVGALVLYAAGEPYAVVKLEDVWVDGDILSIDETKVASEAMKMLMSPHLYTNQKGKQ